jgi:hypothetical protein
MMCLRARLRAQGVKPELHLRKTSTAEQCQPYYSLRSYAEHRDESNRVSPKSAHRVVTVCTAIDGSTKTYKL